MEQCSLVDKYQHQRVISCLHLQFRTGNCVERNTTWDRERRTASKPMKDGDAQTAVINGKSHHLPRYRASHLKTIITPSFTVADSILQDLSDLATGTANSCSVVLWPAVTTSLSLLRLVVYLHLENWRKLKEPYLRIKEAASLVKYLGVQAGALSVIPEIYQMTPSCQNKPLEWLFSFTRNANYSFHAHECTSGIFC